MHIDVANATSPQVSTSPISHDGRRRERHLPSSCHEPFISLDGRRLPPCATPPRLKLARALFLMTDAAVNTTSPRPDLTTSYFVLFLRSHSKHDAYGRDGRATSVYRAVGPTTLYYISQSHTPNYASRRSATATRWSTNSFCEGYSFRFWTILFASWFNDSGFLSGRARTR